MNTKEAKDFLVEQAAEQAALERVPLSQVEKDMMYFTESDAATCPNPLELNSRFEVEYDTDEYEAKMRQLLRHAHDRLEKESSAKKSMWDEAIRVLQEGDHYILILSGDFGGPGVKGSSQHRVRDFLLMVLIGIAIALTAVLIGFWRAR